MLGFESTINPQNLIKIVGAIFEKIEITFFLCEQFLILGVGRKLKKARDICKWTLDIDFQRDRSNGLCCLGGGPGIGLITHLGMPSMSLCGQKSMYVIHSLIPSSDRSWLCKARAARVT